MIAAHLRDADAADPGAPDAADVRSRARLWLVRAGERAASLAAPTDARRAFDEAVSLADDELERASLLERAGELAFDANEMELAVGRLQEASAAFEHAGRTHDAARASARTSLSLWNLGRSDEAAELIEKAFAVLAEEDPDADIAWVAAEAARIAWFRGDRDAALARVDLALDVAEAQGLPRLISEALNTKALAMSNHPHEWRALLREALEVALEHDLIVPALRAYNNLMIALWGSGREDEADAMTLEAFDLARSRGNVNYTTWFAGTRISVLYHDGAWDDAFALADEYLPDTPASQGNPALCRCVLAEMALDRNDPDTARGLLALVAPGLSTSTDLQQQSILSYRAFLEERLAERVDGMLATVQAWIGLLLDLGYDETAAHVLSSALDALPASDATNAALAQLSKLLDTRSTSRRTRGLEAELARVRGVLASRADDHDAAFDAFARALAHARERNRARLVASVLAEYGAALARGGRADEAEPLIDEARTLYRMMGATVPLERLDALATRQPV